MTEKVSDDAIEIIPLTRQQMDEYRNALDSERNHVMLAHAAILKLREEVRVLNGVIARRKRGMRRLRAYVDAVKRLHRPVDYAMGAEPTTCVECGEKWPCRTNAAMHAVMMDAIDSSDKTIETGGKK